MTQSKQYTMSQTLAVANQASQEISQWLLMRKEQGLNQITSVQNVENDTNYQTLDIDLLAITTTGRQLKIEIKADRYHKTGNFFFETVSNAEKETLGCFLYTQADYLFYYFIEIKKLYVLSVPEIRAWFVANLSRFAERKTQTPVGNSHYTTIGKLVPITVVQRECAEHIQTFSL